MYYSILATQIGTEFSARCEATAFGSNEKEDKGYTIPLALQHVYRSVEDYFLSGTTDPSQKVHRTSLPPLYFQHPGTYCCISPSLASSHDLMPTRPFIDNRRLRET